MSTWNELLAEFAARPEVEKGPWVTGQLMDALLRVGGLRGDRNVVIYGSCFLQKPHVPAGHLSIMSEDLNGFMSAIHGMDWDKGLSLILHTPGGQVNAAETVVAYLRSKFSDIEVIVPTFAMSAGTMISLAANRVVLGRQSQLGPIDPQMAGPGGSVSARAVVEQFERAKSEILSDQLTAHIWAPILQSLGPSMLQDAQNALAYSEQMVARWVSDYMYAGDPNAAARGAAIAAHFNDASTHKSHGRRIGRDEAKSVGVVVEPLEGPDRQSLQEAVLTAYHLMTILFENGPLAKLIISSTGGTWAKNFQTPEEAAAIAAAGQGPRPPATPPPGSPFVKPPDRAARRREERKN